MMNDIAIKLAAVLIGLAFFGVWGFALWFPFRHDRVGFLPGCAGAMVGNLVTLVIWKKMGAIPLAVALPFALAAISFICFRHRKTTTSEQAVGGDSVKAAHGLH